MSPLSLVVLALCLVFEIASLAVSHAPVATTIVRPCFASASDGRLSIAQAIHFSPDPGIFEVLAEGVASIIGLLLAFAGIAGSAWLGWQSCRRLAAAIAIGAAAGGCWRPSWWPRPTACSPAKAAAEPVVDGPARNHGGRSARRLGVRNPHHVPGTRCAAGRGDAEFQVAASAAATWQWPATKSAPSCAAPTSASTSCSCGPDSRRLKAQSAAAARSARRPRSACSASGRRWSWRRRRPAPA